MGCYGIGVTRIVAAAIEQNHDERASSGRSPMAPFHRGPCPIGYDRSEAVRAARRPLHAELTAAGIDVLIDDRGERPGAMFADLELIGIPHRVVDRRSRPQGRQGRIPGSPRHGGNAGRSRRNRAVSAGTYRFNMTKRFTADDRRPSPPAPARLASPMRARRSRRSWRRRSSQACRSPLPIFRCRQGMPTGRM